MTTKAKTTSPTTKSKAESTKTPSKSQKKSLPDTPPNLPPRKKYPAAKLPDVSAEAVRKMIVGGGCNFILPLKHIKLAEEKGLVRLMPEYGVYEPTPQHLADLKDFFGIPQDQRVHCS